MCEIKETDPTEAAGLVLTLRAYPITNRFFNGMRIGASRPRERWAAPKFQSTPPHRKPNTNHRSKIKTPPKVKRFDRLFYPRFAGGFPEIVDPW